MSMQTWTNSQPIVVTVDRARMSSGNAVPYGADTAELLDVDVISSPGLALITPNRFRGLLERVTDLISPSSAPTSI